MDFIQLVSTVYKYKVYGHSDHICLRWNLDKYINPEMSQYLEFFSFFREEVGRVLSPPPPNHLFCPLLWVKEILNFIVGDCEKLSQSILANMLTFNDAIPVTF